jgi:hypothetical protein
MTARGGTKGGKGIQNIKGLSFLLPSQITFDFSPKTPVVNFPESEGTLSNDIIKAVS